MALYVGNLWLDFSCSDPSQNHTVEEYPWIYTVCDSNDYNVNGITDSYSLMSIKIIAPSEEESEQILYPSNIYINISKQNVIFHYADILNKTIHILNFADNIQQYLTNDCVPDHNNNCKIPLFISSITEGILNLNK